MIHLMRPRLVKVLLALLGIGLLVWLLAPPGRREPEYREKGVSVWFKQYYRTGPGSRRPDAGQHAQAARALRALGTNAVPYLVAASFQTNQESAWQTNLLSWLAELPEPLRRPPFVPAAWVREIAALGIGEIKPPAELLLPLVTNRWHDPDPQQRWMAIFLLGNIGEGSAAAVPLLREKLRDAVSREAMLAAHSLDRLGATATAAVPALVELVRSNQNYASILACRALARIGPAAREAVPVLSAQLATETNDNRRAQILIALLCVEGDQSHWLNDLSTIMADDRQLKLQQQLIWALREIGTNACVARPLLLAALTNAEPTLYHPALFGLWNAGETNLALAAAFERLQRDDRVSRNNALQFLLGVQPTNSLVLSNLVLEANELSMGSWAIEEAAKLGARAGPVIPRLRDIAESKTNPFREVARRALATIAAEQAAEQAPR